MTISHNVAEHLKELHRLSTTSYASLHDAFQDHLRTGRRLFGLSQGTITRREEAVGTGPRIETPIIVESETFGTLSFFSPRPNAERVFSAAEKELIELMARSLGRIILEHRQLDRLKFQARHDSLTTLPN